MAEATSEAFLSGQGIPVPTGRIEAELVRLWGPAAERAGGPEPDRPNVTRVALANLVVGAGPGCPEELEATLDTVIARCPCRAIVLRRTDEPGRQVAAEVAALCHLPSPGLPQVCSERIVLRAGPEALDLLPGAVRPLLEADLPFVLWWADDPRAEGGPYRALAGECSRLILDLPDPGADPGALRAGLDLGLNPYIKDVAWYGITRWRELVAQFFDGPDAAEALARLEAVEVRAEVPGPGPAVPRIAAWLAAWLAGQLGWEPVSRREAGPGRVEATFRGTSGDVRVTLSADARPGARSAQILGVTLSGRSPEGPEVRKLARLNPQSPQVRVDVSTPRSCVLPRLVGSPDLDAPGRVAAALEASRHDPPYARGLPHALWLLG